MPQRPRNHELEDLSRQALRAALPVGWVVRDVPDDYGVDREVEIFEGGHATGLTFKAQLKASERVSKPAKRVIRVETIRYWNSLDVPVLIAYYVVETGTLYGRWAHSISLATALRTGQASLTVEFYDKDVLGVDMSDVLVQDCRIARALGRGEVPRPLPIRVTLDGAAPLSDAEFRNVLRVLIREAGLRDEITVVTDDATTVVDVWLSTQLLQIRFPAGHGSFKLDVPDGYDADDLRQMAPRDILTGMSVVLAALGADRLAAALFAEFAIGSIVAINPEVAARMAPILEEQGRGRDAYRIGSRLLLSPQQATRDMAMTYLLGALQASKHLSDDEREDWISRLLVQAGLELADGRADRAGRALYNAAQVAQALGMTDQALGLFGEALEKNPQYGELDYFFRERGGLRWLQQDYAGAVADYRTALEVGGDEGELQPLLADALLYAGEYEHARHEAALAPSDGVLSRLALLDQLALREIERVTGCSQQTRRPLTREEIELVSEDAPALITLLREADALDPRVWANLLLLEQDGVLERAVLIALMTLTSGHAWTTATLVAVADDCDDTLVNAIIDSGVRHAGNEYLDAIAEQAAMQEPEMGIELSRCVHARVDANPPAPLPVTVRVHEQFDPGAEQEDPCALGN
ncbi:MAG: hypothetical protein QOE64_1352 [Frankiales bacterium]|nr:hypothetical protein [Frankiales bacterium]